MVEGSPSSVQNHQAEGDLEGQSSPAGGEEGPAGLRFSRNCCHWKRLSHRGLCALGQRTMSGLPSAVWILCLKIGVRGVLRYPFLVRDDREIHLSPIPWGPGTECFWVAPSARHWGVLRERKWLAWFKCRHHACGSQTLIRRRGLWGDSGCWGLSEPGLLCPDMGDSDWPSCRWHMGAD